MCLVGFAVAQSARWRWVVASNRDESFARPAAPLAWWSPTSAGAPHVLGGRDLSAGGTWLALDAHGRLALVTNVRDGNAAVDPASRSRGELVVEALAAAPGGPTFEEVHRVPRNGFNLVVADLAGEGAIPGHAAGSGDAGGTHRGPASAAPEAVYFSNRPQARQHRFGAGVWGVSNGDFDAPWPKVVALKRRLADAVAIADAADARPSAGAGTTPRVPAPAGTRGSASAGALGGARAPFADAAPPNGPPENGPPDDGVAVQPADARRPAGAGAAPAGLAPLVDAAFAALADRSIAADDALPVTGVGLLRERALSPAFIRIVALAAAEAAPAQPGMAVPMLAPAPPDAPALYGTRCSTLVIAERLAGGGTLLHVLERRFDAHGRAAGETAVRYVPTPRPR